MDESSYGYIIKIVTCNRLTKYLSYKSYILYIVYTQYTLYTPRTSRFNFCNFQQGEIRQKWQANSAKLVFVRTAHDQLSETDIEYVWWRLMTVWMHWVISQHVEYWAYPANWGRQLRGGCRIYWEGTRRRQQCQSIPSHWWYDSKRILRQMDGRAWKIDGTINPLSDRVIQNTKTHSNHYAK